jgi:uncharacterized protein
MKILINITHPAHVHFYKNFIKIMEQRGNTIFVVARNKDITFKLLNSYGIKYTILGKHYKSIIGKCFGFFGHIVKLIYYSKLYRVDILLDSGPIYLALVSFIINRPCIIANNTDVNFLLSFSKYFGTYYLHNNSFKKKLGRRQIFIDSINELAFLHSKYFKPDNSVCKKVGINEKGKIILLRFVSWKSVDDIGYKGHSIDEIRNLIFEFSNYGKVLVSSEYKLPNDLEDQRLETSLGLPFGSLQDIEACCSLFYGESGAMASECAVLGVPSFFISPKKLGFIEELEKKYGLVFNFDDKNVALRSAIKFLRKNNIKKEFTEKRNKLLKEKICYTDFLVWYVEKFPSSYETMKIDPNYQYNFLEK